MAQRTWSVPNEEAMLAWNTVLFDKFVRFREVIHRGGALHSRAALTRHPPAPGARVVDLGCGFGDTTFDIARRVGSQGTVLGIDASGRFVHAARREGERLCIANARFVEGDAQTMDLPGRFDMAFSRFGTMFFAAPVAALRNVRRSLLAGGKLCTIVWRRREDNAFVHLAEEIVLELLPAAKPSDEPTCGPGPFSMAGADATSEILLAAGFDRICFERNDTAMCIGRDIDEAVEFALALGPAGEALRLAGEEARRLEPEIVARLRETFAPFVLPDGVIVPSSTWILTAQAA